VTEIAYALKDSYKTYPIVIRSTVPPGTIEGVLTRILEDAGVADRCVIGMYPEFLREGSAVRDFFEPSLNVLGCTHDFPVDMLKEVFAPVQQELLVTNIKTAEAIKYANNTFHALKIAFTNEFSLFCKEYGVQSEEVMELFCQDTILNISHRYLRPGFAFGGSCLPKDLKGLISLSRQKSIETPLFKAILESNRQIIRRLITLLYDFNMQKIGFFGITFKPDTDDLRESPILHILEKLLSKTPTYRRRFELAVFDKDEVLPLISRFYNGQIILARDENELVNSVELIVLGPFKIARETEYAIIASGKPVIDLKWHAVTPQLKAYKHYYTIV
jgi:GDP-mannose 6-dehydrogenase